MQIKASIHLNILAEDYWRKKEREKGHLKP